MNYEEFLKSKQFSAKPSGFQAVYVNPMLFDFQADIIGPKRIYSIIDVLTSMPKSVDLTNKRFGRLTVIEKTPLRANGNVLWKCQCECGNVSYVTTCNLKTENTTSCGCFLREQQRRGSTKHGMRHTRVYSLWLLMKDRCNNPNGNEYKNYGGRGIRVCDEWAKDFMAFFNDMGHPHSFESIERIDVNGNYEKANCKWLLKSLQGRNKTKNRLLTHGGITRCLADWSDITGIAYWTLHSRLRRGWSIEDTLDTPTLPIGGRHYGV